MSDLLTPGAADLWFIPLGGTGEIGMNMNLYGHNGQWLLVDCGVTFDEPLTAPYLNSAALNTTCYSVVSPDPQFIVERQEQLQGLVITHGHEDHVGAVAHLWPRLRCPVYATPFTAEILNRKLAQAGLAGKVPVIIVDPCQTLTLGEFSIEWLDITHSIPEPFALKISTPVGRVLHTADWKIDASPVTGIPFDPTIYKALQNEKMLALIGDSTNATKPGFSISESACFQGLYNTIKTKQGRVVVGCFGSNIARLISLARVAEKTGRYMALAGRSLQNMYAIAKFTGVWPQELSVIDANHVGYLPANEVLLVATGSQGEKRAALYRLAIDASPLITLERGDTVIFSSIVIPGNEVAVGQLIKQFCARNIETIQAHDSVLPIHASGHPCAEELKLLYQWVQPEISIPVHGEPEHLQAHHNIAKEVGVRLSYCARNGDLIKLAPQPSIRRGVVKTGRLAVIS